MSIEIIPAAAIAPDVMMRVDDRQLRLDDRLDRCPRKPICARRKNAAVGRRLRVGVHSYAPVDE
jgi:hypothetical protein